MFRVDNKDTSVSIVNFELVNAGQGYRAKRQNPKKQGFGSTEVIRFFVRSCAKYFEKN